MRTAGLRFYLTKQINILGVLSKKGLKFTGFTILLKLQKKNFTKFSSVLSKVFFIMSLLSK